MVAIGIGEIDILHLKQAVDLFRLVASRRLHLIVGVKDAKEALCVDECVVHIVEDALQLRDGRDDVAEQHHMVHDLTDGHARVAY